jgi:hypothetical protein
MDINEALVNKIIEFLKELEHTFQKSQGLILTEDDLKCLLFSKLYHHLSHEQTIDKNVFASAIHSEVKFYDEEGHLTLIPDLCIIEPRHLSIYHSVEFKIQRHSFIHEYKTLPSKSVEIGGNMIIIELKFCRNRNGIGNLEISSYNDDINKIKRLQEIVSRRSSNNDKMFGIFAVFNKTDNGKQLIESILQNSDNIGKIWCFYGTSLVDFSIEHRFPGNDGYLTERQGWC